MLHFAWPWIVLAAPLPWLVRWLLPPQADRAEAALRVPFLDDLPQRSEPSRSSPSLRLWLAWLAWLALLGAAARPQWLGEPIEQTVSGRDLLLAVDLSGSMEIEDFVVGGRAVDRLTATKAVAGQFIERRTGDRIGLVLFGERAYLQAPLTFDRKTVRSLLDESVIGLAGDKTAIGDAIGLAVKRLRQNPEHQRVLILLSDGANTAGAVSPLQATELALREHLKIYTIGVGADRMMVSGLFGMREVDPSQDLDEETMRAIAERTGGRYFRARDTEELATIYTVLDQLEPVEKERLYYRPYSELFPWPLTAALLLAAGLLLSHGSRR
jgi:Ca-activated chloride channel family protein